MAPCDLDNSGPARFAHHARGRVVDRRHDDDGSGIGIARRSIECVRDHALVVDRHGLDAATDELRRFDNTGIGQRLAQHVGARIGDDRKGDRQAVLRTAGQNDTIGGHGKAAPRDPLRGVGAMLRVPAQRHVRHQVLEAVLLGDRPHCLAHRFGVDGAADHVDPQVDGDVVDQRQKLRAVPDSGIADEGAAPDLAGQQSLLLGQGIGPAHGADGNAETPSEIALRRETVACPQRTVGDRIGNGIGDGLIPRAAPLLDLWLPNCHGVNIAIDTLIESIHFFVWATILRQSLIWRASIMNWTLTIRGDRQSGRDRSLLDRLLQGAGAAIDVILLWQERSRQRRHLAKLDDRLLRDIGLSRVEATHETEKPFWRP